jgi:hypothetical protein
LGLILIGEIPIIRIVCNTTDLSDGFNLGGRNTPSEDFINAMRLVSGNSNFPNSGNHNAGWHVIFVNIFKEDNARVGQSYYWYNQYNGLFWATDVLVGLPYTPGHELGHLLTRKNHYGFTSNPIADDYPETTLPFDLNLMKEFQTAQGVFETKRITKEQETWMRNNW